MFEKTLTDVVKGIRASKRDTALYISQCIAEIKSEISSSDMYVKSNALQKLTFLQMMGYSMNWASFATIEVMSSPRFAHKRIGYLAASQGFTSDTEVILLTTNLLKKELRGAVGGGMHGVYEAGLAINCISNIVTEDLASDLLPELTNLTTHPQPYLRKKAILCLFKVFVKYPQGLRLTFAKLQQCLSDPNPSVVSCAVNVITELSDKNPKNYLHLAPAFFELLTGSSNNWMLIKVVKLLGSLVPEEPRLARKLLEPLAAIVKNTQAKSLLYEAVYTITLCLPYCRKSDGTMPAMVPDIVVLCAQTLRSFVEESDQNLKYLGLVGFGSLMQSHPRVLSAPDYRPLILACLSDQDVTIRTRALDLLKGMASRKNLMELVTQLLKHVEMATGSYKHDLVAKIIEMCSGDKYALLQEFAWYLDILFQLGHMRGVEKHADLLRAQVTDVALRVLPVRAYAVRRSMDILLEGDGAASDDPYGDNGRGKHIMPEILPATAWIIGEYSDLIREALSVDEDDDDDFEYNEESQGSYHSVIQALTAPINTQKLPTDTQKIYIQSVMKVFAAASADKECSKAELEACVRTIHTDVAIYMQSTDVEVVERAFSSIQLLNSLNLFENGLSLGAVNDGDDDTEGDLLGMAPGATQKPKASSGPPTLMRNIKDASPVLNYLLKPSPMKPVGAKAQKKKRGSPTSVTTDLDLPVDLAVFEGLIADEEQYRAGTKLGIEAVSFTQQRPMQIKEPVLTSISSGPGLGLGLGPSHMPPTVSQQHEPNSSFQNPLSESLNVNTRQRQGDPFYLNSTPASGQPVQAEDRNDSRFGTIQLLDSDEEDREKKTRKKKEKKAKRSKKQQQSNADITSMLLFGEADQQVTLYESEDEDEDGYGASNGPSKGATKEFEGLAKVDLTTPLREDEVMPERKHRVVPDRPREETPPAKTKKKPKKNKKNKKSKEEEDSSADVGGGAVGDLLDLGGFGDTAPGSFAASPSPAAAAPEANAINSAFDDLLGLTTATAVPPLGSAFTDLSAPAPSAPVNGAPDRSTKKSHKRPWMKATIKASNSNGMTDWPRVSLLYRIHRHDSGSVSVTFRLDNSGTSMLQDVILEVKKHGQYSLGNVGPGFSSETDKMGPFAYSQADSSLECKGTLQVASSAVSVKLSLPASAHLEPEEGLTLDQVANELASGDWASASAKIDLTSGLSADNVKKLLCGFLHAAAVVDGGSLSSATGTLCAVSPSTGARVRALVKVKADSVKIDVKCSSEALGKALASDLKRVVL